MPRPCQAAVIEGYEFDRVRFRVSGSTFRSADLAHWLALDVADRALRDAGFPTARACRARRPACVLGQHADRRVHTRAGAAAALALRAARRRADAARAGSRSSVRKALLAEIERRYKAPFEPVGDETLAGGLSNTIAGRICNHFDLHGGGYTVDGACAVLAARGHQRLQRARRGRPRRGARRRRRPEPRSVRAGRLREGRRARARRDARLRRALSRLLARRGLRLRGADAAGRRARPGAAIHARDPRLGHVVGRRRRHHPARGGGQLLALRRAYARAGIDAERGRLLRGARHRHRGRRRDGAPALTRAARGDGAPPARPRRSARSRPTSATRRRRPASPA